MKHLHFVTTCRYSSCALPLCGCSRNCCVFQLIDVVNCCSTSSMKMRHTMIICFFKVQFIQKYLILHNIKLQEVMLNTMAPRVIFSNISESLHDIYFCFPQILENIISSVIMRVFATHDIFQYHLLAVIYYLTSYYVSIQMNN